MTDLTPAQRAQMRFMRDGSQSTELWTMALTSPLWHELAADLEGYAEMVDLAAGLDPIRRQGLVPKVFAAVPPLQAVLDGNLDQAVDVALAREAEEARWQKSLEVIRGASFELEVRVEHWMMTHEWGAPVYDYFAGVVDEVRNLRPRLGNIGGVEDLAQAAAENPAIVKSWAEFGHLLKKFSEAKVLVRRLSMTPDMEFRLLPDLWLFGDCYAEAYPLFHMHRMTPSSGDLEGVPVSPPWAGMTDQELLLFIVDNNLTVPASRPLDVLQDELMSEATATRSEPMTEATQKRILERRA